MATPRIGIIGGGASGIGTAKALHQAGYDLEIIEATDRFGGNWQTSGPAAKMYESAHLISSKRNTQFSDHPMPKAYPHYPRHGLMLSYLEEMARDFDLVRRTRFNTTVTDAHPSADGGWNVRFDGGGGAVYDILVVCNGLLRKPILPSYPGVFTGACVHAGDYRTAEIFKGRRVLVVGGGNSGCDIAVDAALNARAAFHSTRRGYHYMPKFIDGRPTQEWLMDEAARFPDPDAYWEHVRATFKLAGYDGQDYGLPKPDHAIQEAHPILNSQILYHIGHGDVVPKPDVGRLDGTRVHFTDGTSETIDLIVWATGYDIDLPFLSPRVYDWRSRFPSLFLKMVPQEFDNLLFAGYLNTPSGIGNVANIMGRFVAAYVHARTHRTRSWDAFQAIKADPDALDLGEARFMDTPRHRFEVDLWKFIKALNFVTGRLLETPSDPARQPDRALNA
ncbi:MAG TPA: NAD(P)-binding domain-containing protein [Azospirillum sp.]